MLEPGKHTRNRGGAHSDIEAAPLSVAPSMAFAYYLTGATKPPNITIHERLTRSEAAGAATTVQYEAPNKRGRRDGT